MKREQIKNEMLLKKIVDELSKEMENYFGLIKIDDFKSLPADKKRVFAIMKNPPGISFRQHYEPDANIMIYDYTLNTLGLVYIFCSGDEPEANYDNFLRKCVDEACYLRHLFIREADDAVEKNSRTKRTLAITVELVIICPETAKADIGNTLRDISQKTNYLYFIGVNLLTFPEKSSMSNSGKKFFPDKYKINRAFSWLLKKTGEWYNDDNKQNFANKQDRKNIDNKRLKTIILENYRLPGKRILELNPDSNIHLIHGYNGSGKSSIVEALEMVMTGKSERIERTANFKVDYDKVIRNSNSGEPAKIKLEFKDIPQNTKEFTITPEGTLALGNGKETPEARSFRLDQGVMDCLTRAGTGERANIFIKAFFPNDRVIVEEYEKIKKDADNSFNELPTILKERIGTPPKEDDIINVLTEIRGGRKLQSIEWVETCLPVSFCLLEELIPFSKELEEPLNSLKSGLILEEKKLYLIDKALESIIPNIDSIPTFLRESLSLLNYLNNWIVCQQEVFDFKSTLDEWLKMTALADLSEKYYLVVKSLKDSRYREFEKQEEGSDVFIPALYEADADRIKTMSDKWSSRRDELISLLKSTPSKPGVTETASRAFKPVITQSDADKLNRLGDWIAFPMLGKTIQDSINKNIKISFPDQSKMMVGEEKWAEELIQKTQKLLNTWEEIKKLRPEFEKKCIERYQRLEETVKIYKSLKQKGEDIHKTFLTLLEDKGEKGKLVEVLNELLSLFTPARWAYEDIVIRHEFSSEKQKHDLHFEINELKQGRCIANGEERNPVADLRLNTAELNTFAFSLFILCAMKSPNPLSVLIFDDPLQNMDEITVTTLVRGLAKLSYLFPGDRQILMFFHGLEDLECFCSEMPSAIYFLPWLSPSPKAVEKPIAYDKLKSLVNPDKQSLNDLLK